MSKTDHQKKKNESSVIDSLMSALDIGSYIDHPIVFAVIPFLFLFFYFFNQIYYFVALIISRI